MRTVAAKSAEQQAMLGQHRIRSLSTLNATVRAGSTSNAEDLAA
jgi:hypothetical protein